MLHVPSFMASYRHVGTRQHRRPRGRSRRLGIIVVGLAIVAASCGRADRVVSAPVDDVSEPLAVKVVAVDYAFDEAPDEIPAGAIDLTFENRGAVSHEIAIAGIGDAPLDRFVTDMRGLAGIEGEPFPEYLDQVAFPYFSGIDAGTTAEGSFTLTEGRYVMFCSATGVAEGQQEKRHYQLGMVRELTVTEGDPTPKLPPADGSIVATDYAFDVDIEAGDRTVQFVNDGPAQVHFSTVDVYPKGVDVEEAKAAFEALSEPGPLPQGVPRTRFLGFSGIASEGLSTTFELYHGRFESGRTYLFACYLADRTGGKPHAEAYDMYTIVTIE
jgi:hypothetical protein